jgi:hypothetical protein
MLHLPGERRRAIALASLVTLIFYALANAIAGIPGAAIGPKITNVLAQSFWLQLALLAPIWLGIWIVTIAQRQLIAQNEGAYGAALTLSQVRGMRGPGLLLGTLIAALTGAGAIIGVVTPRMGIVGLFAALYLLALGMPNAPAARYIFRPQQPPQYLGPTRIIAEDAGPRALPPPPGRGTVIDSHRS